MDSPIITISLEEYKELLELKIRTELEAKHKEEVDAINYELEATRTNSTYWYNRAGELAKEIDDLKCELTDMTNKADELERRIFSLTNTKGI